MHINRYRLKESKLSAEVKILGTLAPTPESNHFRQGCDFAIVGQKQSQMIYKQISNGSVPVKSYLWILKFEVQVIFICNEIILIFFNHLSELIVHIKIVVGTGRCGLWAAIY